MNKWKIDFVMHSGNKISGIYEGPETDSTSVAESLLAGDPNRFVGMYSLYGYGKENLLVKKSEVAAAAISLYKEGV